MFGDVLHRALRTDHGAGRIAHRLADGANPDAAADRGDDLELEVVRDAVVSAGLNRGEHPRATLRCVERERLLDGAGAARRQVVDDADLVGP